jgi:hypothetical protein
MAVAAGQYIHLVYVNVKIGAEKNLSPARGPRMVKSNAGPDEVKSLIWQI